MAKQRKRPKGKDIHLHLENDPELLRWLISKSNENERSLTAEVRYQLKCRLETEPAA